MQNVLKSIAEMQEIASAFAIDGTFTHGEVFGNGHINTTYIVSFAQPSGETQRYILQKINTAVFTNYESLNRNIALVTQHLKKQIAAAGGDPLRETLTLVPTKSGESFTRYHDEVYRVYPFIENTTCYESATPELFYHAAKAFGKFACQLNDFDASLLTPTLPRFHDTAHRYQNLQDSIAADAHHRASGIAEEIAFTTQRAAFCSIVLNEIAKGTIPLRVCHNDTKLNNVMMDNDTNEGLCVIDLDTVMEGSLLYDFGDSIRFGASSAAEDEENLDLVVCDLAKYELYAKGYLEECGSVLSEKEFALLAHSAILITLECGMRFLTDYLNGDVYFKIEKPNHNLIRARNQFKLVRDMEEKLPQMIAINEKFK